MYLLNLMQVIYKLKCFLSIEKEDVICENAIITTKVMESKWYMDMFDCTGHSCGRAFFKSCWLDMSGISVGNKCWHNQISVGGFEIFIISVIEDMVYVDAKYPLTHTKNVKKPHAFVFLSGYKRTFGSRIIRDHRM